MEFQGLQKSGTIRGLIVVWIILIVAFFDSRAQSTENITVTDFEAMQQFKTSVKNNNRNAVDAYEALLEDADQALNAGPFAVMDKTGVPLSGDKHDYMSIGPYWWPNPDTPDHLPYIRKDGEVNPETRNELTDYVRKNDCFRAIGTLGQAFYFTEEAKYAEKALQLINTWFLDSETKMNPNLNFGQGVPGRSNGRPYGIIEFRILDEVIKTLEILEHQAALPPATAEGMYNWLAQFVDWLQTSELGMMEGTRKNNHATWYDVQTSSWIRAVIIKHGLEIWW